MFIKYHYVLRAVDIHNAPSLQISLKEIKEKCDGEKREKKTYNKG